MGEAMTFIEAVQKDIRNYSTFTGLARRPEYWWFALFIALGNLALGALDIRTPGGTIYLGTSLAAAFSVAVLLPMFAVTIRRLRDAGREWTNIFWLLLPVAGTIVLIVHLSSISISDAPPPPPTTPAAPEPGANI
jgi:uncharacterized membrane protein YhaH (DUF805 family)